MGKDVAEKRSIEGITKDGVVLAWRKVGGGEINGKSGSKDK